MILPFTFEGLFERAQSQLDAALNFHTAFRSACQGLRVNNATGADDSDGANFRQWWPLLLRTIPRSRRPSFFVWHGAGPKSWRSPCERCLRPPIIWVRWGLRRTSQKTFARGAYLGDPLCALSLSLRFAKKPHVPRVCPSFKGWKKVVIWRSFVAFVAFENASFRSIS